MVFRNFPAVLQSNYRCHVVIAISRKTNLEGIDFGKT